MWDLDEPLDDIIDGVCYPLAVEQALYSGLYFTICYAYGCILYIFRMTSKRLIGTGGVNMFTNSHLAHSKNNFQRSFEACVRGSNTLCLGSRTNFGRCSRNRRVYAR